MTTVQLVLGLAALGAGLFAGIIAAMVGVIQRMLNTLTAEAYTPVMQGIITSGRRSLVVWLCLLVPLLSGLLSLILLRNERGGAGFTLALSAYLVFIIGPIGISRQFNEPSMTTFCVGQPKAYPPTGSFTGIAGISLTCSGC